MSYYYDGNSDTRDSSTGKRVNVKGMSRLRLKFFAIVMVAVGIICTALVQRHLPANVFSAPTSELTLLIVGQAVSWTAVPIYAWLLVTGFEHTRNPLQYIIRLVVLAAICEVPYDIVYTGHTFDWSSQNPVWALVVCLIVLVILRAADEAPDAQQHRGTLWTKRIAAVVSGELWIAIFQMGTAVGIVPVGTMLLGFTVIFYACRNKENMMMTISGIWGAVMFITPAMGLLPIHFRNDRPGYDVTSKWAQLLFYALYPALLIACIPLA